MIGTLPTLYFYEQTGCAVCAQAAPILEAWRARNFDEVVVVRRNVTHHPWKLPSGHKVRATPTYALVTPYGNFDVHEEAMDESELTRWFNKAMNGAVL